MRGFVDLQVNGYRGISFSAPDLDEAGAETALRGLIADGTAVLLPTVVTAPAAVYERNLPLLAKVITRPEFAEHIPGLHLEGPFLSRKDGSAGVHNTLWMQDGTPAAFDRMQELAGGTVRILTVAPEIDGAIGLIRHARREGVVVSIGHSAADEFAFAAACDAGATWLTHLGNGLPHLINRHRNPFYSGLAEDRLCAGVIGDGHHLPWRLLKVIMRTKGIDNCVLVSDASSLAGMPPGRYECFGAQVVIEPGGRLYDLQSGYLSGSAFTIREVVNATRIGLGLDDATMHQLAVVNPLRLIGRAVPDSLKPLPRTADGCWLPASSAFVGRMEALRKRLDRLPRVWR
jgi:N-acetylglucosamine-6-phosphate deacetylase